MKFDYLHKLLNNQDLVLEKIEEYVVTKSLVKIEKKDEEIKGHITKKI